MPATLLVLTKGVAANAASRYRYLQYLPYLEAAGFTLLVRPLFDEGYYKALAEPDFVKRQTGRAVSSAKGLLHRLCALGELGRVDGVLLENQLFPYEPGLLEGVLFASGKPVVVEFDDAIYETPLHRAKLLRSIRRATHTIVGNEELRRFAGQASPRVSLVPTTVDLARYPKAPKSERAPGPFRIGWIGQASTLPYLEGLARPLARLAKEREIELCVICSRAPRLPGVPTRLIPWSEAGEAQALAQLDAGLMPLPDTPWTRGKCGLKLLQYMAAFVPAVASPVGVNTRILRHGENGLLARTDDDWHVALLRLIDEPELGRGLIEKGRETVAQGYDLAVWAPRLVALYERLFSPTPS